jgi:hypothetical protein
MAQREDQVAQDDAATRTFPLLKPVAYAAPSYPPYLRAYR